MIRFWQENPINLSVILSNQTCFGETRGQIHFNWVCNWKTRQNLPPVWGIRALTEQRLQGGDSWQPSMICFPHFEFKLDLRASTLKQHCSFFGNCTGCGGGQLHNRPANNREHRRGKNSRVPETWWLTSITVADVTISLQHFRFLSLELGVKGLRVLTCRVLTWSGVPPVPLTVLFLGAGLFPAAFSLDAILAFSASMRFGLLSITWTTAYSTREAKPKSRQAISQMSMALT